jgi:hypothetical protein
MPQSSSRLHAGLLSKDRRRFNAGRALRAVFVATLMTGMGANMAKAAASTDSSMDITAPPIALLFGMATLGLLLGRRK